MAVLGSASARWAVGPRVRDPEATAWLGERAARLGRLAAIVSVPALGLVFLRQLLEFRDPFVPWTEDAALLLSTAWGRAWLWAIAAAAVAAVGFWLAVAGRRPGWWLATAALAPLALFPGLTGHARGAGAWIWMTLPADVVHVVAAGAWMGGLVVVLESERTWRRARAPGNSLLPRLVPAFSPVAVAAVAALVVTGALASIVQLPSPAALTSTAYGRTLLLKLALAAGVLGLGALNWKRLTPGLSAEGGPERLRRAATAELLLAQVVLLVTAVLIRLSPTDH